MKTSWKTREYWVEHAKGWAEGRLTDTIVDPGGSTPQLDEFMQVMDELWEDAQELAAIKKVISDRERK